MIFQLLTLALLLPGHYSTVNLDSSYGKLASRATIRGQFFSFDKNQENRFIFDETNGSRMMLIYGVPEMDCFVANHTQEDLQISYSTNDSKDGRRVYVADRIVSLKSGDDTRTWPQKDVADSAAHHIKLAKLRREMLGKN